MVSLDKYSQVDVVVVGAGIVGAAVAREYLSRFPQQRVLVLEKSATPAAHQSGRNSGVIHAGVYYPPGSLKARYCRQGLDETISYCRQYQLPVEQCGKVIVASNAQEAERLDVLFHQCQQNDLQPERWSATKISQQEPAIKGVEGVFVAHTGITDYAAITRHMLDSCARSNTYTLATNADVMHIDESSDGVTLSVMQQGRSVAVKSQSVICCAGVMADRLIRAHGMSCDFAILPFKGEYYRLASRFDNITSRLIYPVPDPAMPFLGVHLTRMIGGYTTVGPNAVLASGREAYDKFSLSPAQWAETLGFAGLYPLLWRFRKAVASELLTSVSKRAYARRIQRYCPAVSAADFSPYRSGIRAQAVTRDGRLMQDFHFVQSQRVLHVGNAPSPAATSAMPIARAVLDKLL